MLNKMFQKIGRQESCVTFSGCPDEELKKAGKELADCGLCPLPEEYAAALRIHNGIIYDGLELLGTTSHKRIQKNYIVRSILEINRRYSKIDFFARKLILGELPESFLIYNSETQSYEIVDRLNLDSKRIFGSFNELFKTIMSFLVIKD